MPETDPETYAVIGAAMEVHRELGHGFSEPVYQAALAVELAERNIPYRAEVTLPIYYKGKLLPCGYRTDFVCYQELIVETKALSQTTKVEHAQVINQLKASRHRRALLLNFGAASLQQQRFVYGALPTDSDIVVL